MANDKAFKVKNGILAQRYLQSAGTETEGSDVYNLSGASYDGKSLNVGAQDTAPQAISLSPDGLTLIMMGSTGDDFNQYTLSTAWDISTGSFDSITFSVAGQDTSPVDHFFKPDGTKVYVLGFVNDSVYQYSLSTAWDISTMSYDSVSFSISAQAASPRGLYFKSDGTKFYIVGFGTDAVYQYSLSTAWDLSTASYDSVSFSIATEDATPLGLAFNDSGSKMFVTGGTNDTVYEYTLSTAWDLSTASYSSVSFYVGSQETSPTSATFKPDGTKMYITGSGTDTVYQYSTGAYTQTLDLSTGTYFSFTPSGATTASFTNPPASGLAIGFAVEINGDGSAITWPASVKWPAGTAPTATATKEIYTFITTDGGTTYYGKQAATELA